MIDKISDWHRTILWHKNYLQTLCKVDGDLFFKRRRLASECFPRSQEMTQDQNRVSKLRPQEHVSRSSLSLETATVLASHTEQSSALGQCMVERHTQNAMQERDQISAY